MALIDRETRVGCGRDRETAARARAKNMESPLSMFGLRSPTSTMDPWGKVRQKPKHQHKLLSTDRIVVLQSECFADDVALDFMMLRHFSEDECRQYFESGGKTRPDDADMRAEIRELTQGVVEPAAFLELDRVRCWARMGV